MAGGGGGGGWWVGALHVVVLVHNDGCVVSGLSELAEMKNQKIRSMVPDLDDMSAGGDDEENLVMNGS